MVHSKVHTQTAEQHAEDNTGYTYSLSSSYSSTALDYEREHRLPPKYDSPRMSRRSLRLHGNSIRYADDSLLDSPLDRSVSHNNESFVRQETRTLRSRRSNRSVSGSSSLLQTPLKNQSSSLQIHNSSMHSCAASDASLRSSLLDESSIQERTQVDSFWGLDQDGDVRDRTLQADRSLTLLSNDTHAAQTQTSTICSGYICKDCITQRNTLPAYTASKACTSSSCSYSSAALNSTAVDGGAAAAATIFSPPYTTVYSRERTRRHRAGVLGRFSETSLYYSRKAAASVVCVFTMLMQSVLTKTCQQGKALLCSLTDRCVGVCRSAATSSAAALTRPVQFIGLTRTSHGYANGGHASYCGTMNLNEQVTQKDQKILNGPLCDDCKGKQNSKTVTVSLTQQLIEALWLLVAFAGNRLLKAVQDLLSSVWFVTKKSLSFLYLAAVSPGSAASAAVQWLGTAWYNLVMLNSLINVFFLTRVLPILRKLLLIFLPLLLLLVLLGYLGVPGFWTLPAFLPAANVTTEPNPPEDVPSKVQPDTVPSYERSENLAALSAEDSERLARIEKSLATLWDKVTVAGGKQDERHAEVLGLCKSLKDELRTNTDRESMSTWVTSLLERKVILLRQEIEKEAADSQPKQEEMEVNQAQESRIAKLELLLQDLALKTEELQRRQDVEAEKPLYVGPGDDADGASHEALLAEVHRLENALDSIRTDLQGVLGCKGRCDQLDSLQSTVSLQVKQELKSLLYGEEAEGEELPESLLQWLSTKFVSHSDVLASLGALEKRILGNLSLQLEQMQLKPSEEQVTQTVRQTTTETGLSEQDVQLIVQNALKLYSEDRVGLVDYALESGGGSILSTRCSETYETKTALMSLFGFPLWYFSQSPRAVIQPDVHPGNCWAFKGSTGYLVIRLCVKVVPTAFSLEHIPKALSPTGSISSAPRNFVVYGLGDEQQEEGHLLGQYIYEEDGNALQTYPVTENNTEAFQIVELRVLSNWGHPEYTCLYRFRVHGKPAEEEEKEE